MVMRGMSVPAAKRMYITLDTKREAEREGVPFGHVCDPVGEPVERGFSLYRFARAQGREQEYLLSFLRGVFAEGIDAGTEEGLRRIAERAGLDWEQAQAHRTDESWREELEENRQAMFAAGLWGVPSFRLLAQPGHPEFATWGQDRIWLVEEEVLRRLAEPPASSGS
jgi:2-hydroxychromene-2-carboxylate isomerase